MTTKQRTLLCTIKTLAGDMIEAEPVIGQCYVSVDNRDNKHISGDPTCYLLEALPPEFLFVPELNFNFTKKRVISIFSSKACGRTVREIVEVNWPMFSSCTNIDNDQEEDAILIILNTPLPEDWQIEVDAHLR